MKNETIELKLLVADPDQPRQMFDYEDMEALKVSIKNNGVLSPLIVEPLLSGKHLIIDGERRFKASKELNIKAVPVNILSKALSPSDRNIMRFNLQESHKDWSVLEKAQAIQNLQKELQLTEKELAVALGMSYSTVNNYINLLSFSPKTKRRLVKAKMPYTHLHTLSILDKSMTPEVKIKVPDYMDRCIKRYENGNMVQAKDLSRVVSLIKQDNVKQVVKYFTNEDFNGKDAQHEAGYTFSNTVSRLITSANSVIKLLEMVSNNKVAMATRSLDKLYELQETLNNTVDNIKTTD